MIVGAFGAVQSEEVTVQISDKGFMPDKAEVTVGQKIVWQNVSLKDHTVTAKSKPAGEPGQDDKDRPMFDSGLIKPGASWSTSFSKEGTYEYACRIDRAMSGTIVVNPAK
jgi:plastocyanin